MSSFVTSRFVEFRDTDTAGIVHFSVYFTWMEAAEHAFLRHLGRSVHQSADEQDKHAVYSWPRVAAKCDYQGSPRFEDEVTIVVTISRIGSTSVTYQFVFQCDGQPIAQGEMTAVHCLIRQGEKPQPKPIPDDLRDQLNEYLA